MSVRFKKSVDKELRKSLLDDLDKFESVTAMTKPERNDLYIWVSAGNSPYDNPSLICCESGYPMNFIEASRFEVDVLEQSLSADYGESYCHWREYPIPEFPF